MKKHIKIILAIILSVVVLAAGGIITAVLLTSKDNTPTDNGVKITYMVDGVEYTSEATNANGNVNSLLSAPKKDGYTFLGWYTDNSYTETSEVSTDTVFTADTMLYALYVLDSIAAKCDIEQATGFDVDNLTLSISVPNAQEYFSLSEAIKVSSYAKWTVTSDISGNNQIPSATVSLAEGDNIYYINTISGSGSNKRQYTVNMRRREIYTVTYILNNGEQNIVERVEEDNKAENKSVTKKGYSFIEWQNNDTVWDFETAIKGNVVFNAVWNANGYTVTFNSNNGSVVENKNVVFDTEYNFDVSERKGYTFNGWKTEQGTMLTGSNGKSISNWTIAENITVYADWTVNDYTISYHNVNGASNGNPTKYTVEDNNIMLVDAVKVGYMFKGWYADSGFGIQVTSINTNSAENVNLWAKWEIITYQATFKADGKAVGTANFTVENTVLDEPTVPSKIGYNGAWESYTISAQNLIINAIYTAIEYTITYENTKGATNANVTKYTIESADITLSSISATGYTFDGWYDGTNKVETIATGSYGNKTLTAKWTAIEYTLILDYDEDLGEYATGTSNPTKFTIESDFDLTALQSKVIGATFVGWFTAKNDGEGDKITRINPGRSANLTLYAHWGLETYTITYHNVHGVTNTNATTYTVQSENITITELSRFGYTFGGWYSDAALQNAAATAIVKGSHGDLDYYAKWIPVQYSITYTLYGGTYQSGSNPESYTIEDTVVLISPRLDGYEFDGWYTASEGGEKIETIEQGTTGNLSLYARWIHISTITFNSKGGSAVSSISKAAGKNVSEPTQPTRDYYTFGGWYSDEACGTRYVFDVMPEEDITVYAKWIPVEYTITYILNGGVNARENITKYTVEDAFTFANPTKTGYTFVAWFMDAQFTSAVVTEITKGSHGNITLYANYSVNQYTISFNSNGGTSVAAITQNYATNVSAPSSPAKNGYNFDGWYSDAALKNAYAFTTMPAENITLYAKWSLATYDIIYHLGGGTNNAHNPISYTIESAVITFGVPENRGYTFGGWYSDSGYSNPITGIESGSYGNVEVYAKWNITTYSVTYVLPQGSVNNNITSYTVETDITSLTNASLSGYAFGGWYSDSAFRNKVLTIAGGEIGNITLYAKFTPNTYIVWMDGTDEVRCIVSFDLNGASGIAPTSQTITENVTLTYPTIPSRSGYIFGGWYNNADCTGSPYDFSAMISGDITLYAKWLEVGNTNVISVGNTANVTLSGKMEKVYKFVPLVSGNVTITTTGSYDTLGSLYYNGSLIKQDDDGGANGNFLIVYNVTAGEVYEIRVRGFSASASGTVTLSLNGNTTVVAGGYTRAGNKTTVTYGENFKLNVPESQDSYKFLGWQDASGTLYTDANGNSVRVWDKAENTLLVSKWERMDYTVTFVTNGGSAVETVTLEYGARLDLNKYVTTRNGYTFGGWYLNLSDSESYNASTMPDHNITLNAKWITFALGSIKYDEDKKAVSVNDTINAELFDAICLDTDGNHAEITVTISGEQTAGSTITVRLTAKSGNKTKLVTITDVKVYDAPTINVTGNKDYINLADGLNGEWFGASGTDTFGEATQIAVRIDGEYAAGDTVTVYIDSVDPAGNITTQTVENVKLYGLPVISYDTEKTAIRVNDTINAALFNATATDSFWNAVSVKVTLYSGTKAAGNTVTIRLSATDTKSNVQTIDIVCKVYGTPTISTATNTEFTVDDEITVESLAIKASDTFGEALNISIVVKGGTQTGGSAMVYTATVTDIAGNVATKDISVKIYGTPNITVGRTNVKVSETVDVSTLKAVARDSFGKSLQLTVTKKSGTFAGGQTLVYTLSATDKFGNVCTRDINVKVYDVNDISLTYMGGASNLIKLTSKGEEFSAQATDSFGGNCTLSIEAASGFTLAGGQIISLYIVATDAAGNVKKSEMISEIKVYDFPTAEYIYGNILYSDKELTDFDFRVIDSFGEELYFTISISGNIVAGEKITVGFDAEDEAGNKPLPLILGVVETSDFTFESVDGGYAVSAYNGNSADVIIPNMYNNKEVVAINASAFANNTHIISIDIPNSVTSIGQGALSGCSSLESITIPFVGATLNGTSNTHFGYIFGASFYSENSGYIPASLKSVIITGGTSIGNDAFYGCRSLTSIDIPNSVTSIGQGAFSGCSSLTSVTIPDSVTSIGNRAFYGCRSLTSIDIPNSVTSIGQGAFSGCSSLTSVTIPDSVTSIGNRAFYGCNSLTSIEIPNSLTSIGDSAFDHCSKLMSIIIPSSVTSIGERAFEGCSRITIYCQVASTPSGWKDYWNISSCPVVWDCIGHGITEDGIKWGLRNNDTIVIAGYTGYITEIIIPNELNGKPVTSIGNRAFDGCSSLTSIEIPNSVTSIGYSAFDGCSSLTSIEIPNSVKSIGSDAFRDCSNLTIYCEATSTPSGWNGYWNISNRPVVWDCIGHGITEDGIKWGLLKNGTVAICGYCGNGLEIMIPNEINGKLVTSIGYCAFYNYSSLTSIEIPNSVKSIWNAAFYNCSSLTSILIPSSVMSIEYHAFYNCSSLTIYCEASSKPRGWDSGWNDSNCPVVWNCIGHGITEDGMKWVLLKNDTVVICGYCGNGLEIMIPNEINGKPVTSIGNRAFDGCSSLTSIEIPNSVTSIGNSAFRDCSSLTSIEIPSGVTSIKGYAFDGCSSLTSVTIPDSVTSIGDYAFYGCNSLTSIEIPNSVTSIGYSAFHGCNSLTSIEIPNSVTSIGYSAFYGCNILRIYCQVASKPSGWSSNWNPSNRPVVWNYKNK